MTQKHVQISAHFLLLFFGVSTAWAEVTKESHRELLSAPKCCCEKIDRASSPCCSGTECCTACVKGKVAAIERRLRMLCSIDFKETPFEEVVERFREWSGVNIVVDQPALDDAGIRLDRPVTIKTEGVLLKSALNLLL